MPQPVAVSAGPRGRSGSDDVQRRVIEVVSALAIELGTLPHDGQARLDNALDRDLGFGSLERVELALRLEHAFGVRLGDAVLAEADRCRDLLHAVAAPAAPGPELEVAPVPIAPGGERLPVAARTLTDVLAWHAEATPERIHVVLRGDDGAEAMITYGALASEARTVAAALAARGVGAGDRVAVMLRTERAFFSAFFGVLQAGAVPVPVYPPFRPAQLEEYARRQVGILRNAQARLLVTFAEASRIGRLVRRQVPGLEAVLTAEDLGTAPASAAVRHADAADVALIQYTSGSTGDPKGVALTHANVLANIRALGQALAVRPDDVCVSWLPLYHDMGLIGAWLGSLYHGIPVVVMSPLAFLARPARWLTVLSRHRGTISAAPNFAFDLCVKRAADEDLAGVDLSRWRLAVNGSEAVSSETMTRFAARFASYGFRETAMAPMYGLAEAAVGLTATPPGRGPRIDAVVRESFERARHAIPAPSSAPAPLRFVSCGRPLPGHDVRVVDATGRPLADRREGRIEFRGPSVTAGYHGNPELTRATTHAGWMDSGDLGYVADGELYVTGRRKDIIIKAGRNLYPQELEELVGAVPGIRRGCVAAIGVPDPELGTERLVVIAETRTRDADARAALRAAVVERVVDAIGLPPDTVVIAEPGAVLKTSSGKIRRSATREAYRQGLLGRRPSARRQRARLAMAAARRVAATGVRSVGAAAFAVWTGVLLGVLLPPLWIALMLSRRPHRVAAVTRWWCRTILRLAGCGPAVHGLEHLPRRRAILVANHASYIDVAVLMAALPVDIRFVAKRELLSTPIVGAVLRKGEHLTVDRVDVSRGAADAARVTAAVQAGALVCVFPEGTFLRRAALLPFRLGAFKAAVESRCPVVPVALLGTRTVLPAGTWRPRPGRVTVAIGTPLEPRADDWREMARLRELARGEITRAGTVDGAAGLNT
jgi:1-acyl-sn-glycerol-3-phosphate acyltransferase